MKQIPMRFAGAQMPCTPNVADNVKEIKKAIDYAVDNECDFLVTPEGSLSGYDHTSFTANGFYGDANQVRDMILESFDKMFTTELEQGLKEVEDYAKNKVGLCLGTAWKEQERFGTIGRNQIRFYSKDGQFRGATNKSLCVSPSDLSYLENDINVSGVECMKLGSNDVSFNVVGLICNDLWGHGLSGHKALCIKAKEQFQDNINLFVHSTNGYRGNGEFMEKLYDNWHNAHLTMMSYLTEIPIITVDNCNHIDGTEFSGQTSSESGVVVKGEFVTQVPREGTQYFFYDFFGVKHEH